MVIVFNQKAKGSLELGCVFERSDAGSLQENAQAKRKEQAMRLIIEIAAAVLLVFCISVTSAAAAKAGKSADGLSCSFSVPANATSAARCAAIKRQCGGKFSANYCGDRLLSAM